MTYQEYLTMGDGELPVRRPIGSVKMTAEDVYAQWKDPDNTFVMIFFPCHGDDYINYVIPHGETIWWTVDGDGNKKQRSVFRWAEGQGFPKELRLKPYRPPIQEVF